MAAYKQTTSGNLGTVARSAIMISVPNQGFPRPFQKKFDIPPRSFDVCASWYDTLVLYMYVEGEFLLFRNTVLRKTIFFRNPVMIIPSFDGLGMVDLFGRNNSPLCAYHAVLAERLIVP